MPKKTSFQFWFKNLLKLSPDKIIGVAIILVLVVMFGFGSYDRSQKNGSEFERVINSAKSLEQSYKLISDNLNSQPEIFENSHKIDLEISSIWQKISKNQSNPASQIQNLQTLDNNLFQLHQQVQAQEWKIVENSELGFKNSKYRKISKQFYTISSGRNTIIEKFRIILDFRICSYTAVNQVNIVQNSLSEEKKTLLNQGIDGLENSQMVEYLNIFSGILNTFTNGYKDLETCYTQVFKNFEISLDEADKTTFQGFFNKLAEDSLAFQTKIKDLQNKLNSEQEISEEDTAEYLRLSTNFENSLNPEAFQVLMEKYEAEIDTNLQSTIELEMTNVQTLYDLQKELSKGELEKLAETRPIDWIGFGNYQDLG